MADDTGEIGREAAEAVGFANIKTLGDGPAFYTNMAMANAVANQQAMQSVQTTLIGAIGKSIAELDPMEAVSALKMISGNDMAQQLAALLSAINSGQQGVKSAGNTPPVTP